MGQYFRPVIYDVKTDKYTVYSSHSCGNGAKLMEHSYLLNNFVGTVLLKELFNKPKRLAWVGDYADDEDAYALKRSPEKIFNYIWAAWAEHAPDPSKLKPLSSKQNLMCTYVINHDKKEYVDMCNYYSLFIKTVSEDPCDCMVTNPIPLLTAIGNDKGGGDYHRGGTNYDKVGSWATDLIEVVDWETLWNHQDRYKNYQDITRNILFIEKSC